MAALRGEKIRAGIELQRFVTDSAERFAETTVESYEESTMTHRADARRSLAPPQAAPIRPCRPGASPAAPGNIVLSEVMNRRNVFALKIILSDTQRIPTTH